MSARITAADVREKFAQLQRKAVNCDIPGAREWALVQGSPTYGRAWRLVEVDPGHGGHSSPVFGPSYLGWTAREAYLYLEALHLALNVGYHYGTAHALKEAGR